MFRIMDPEEDKEGDGELFTLDPGKYVFLTIPKDKSLTALNLFPE